MRLKQNILIILLLTLVCIPQTLLSKITIDDTVEFITYSDLITFKVDATKNFSIIEVESNYVMFNNTKFYVTPYKSTITLRYLSSSPSTAYNTEVLNFTIKMAVTGTEIINISGFRENTRYKIRVDNNTEIKYSNSSGYLSVNVTTTSIFDDEHDVSISHVTFTPIVTTNDTTGVRSTNVTLNGYLVDDGGEPCTVGFEWGYDNSYGNTVSLYQNYQEDTDEYNTGDANGCTYNGNYSFSEGWTNTANFNDSNWNTYTLRDTNESYRYIYINYTKPLFPVVNATWKVKTAPHGIDIVDIPYPQSSIIRLRIAVYIRVPLLGLSEYYHCEYQQHNGSDWETFYTFETIARTSPDPYQPFTVFEEAITWWSKYNSSQTFTYNLTGLTPGHIYHYRTYATNSNTTSYGSDKTFLTKPLPPSLTYTNKNHTHILLTWTKGSGANNTIIRRSTTNYPASLTDGTLIYNGTATTYDDTNVTPGKKYYYSAWSYTKWGTLQQYSDNYSTLEVGVPPAPPTNVTYTLISLGNTANLTINWTKGVGADTTLIRKNTPSPPSNTTDGTLVYNNTGNGTIDANINQAWSYRLWSYNSTVNLYSEPVDLEWHAIWITVYNESSGQPIAPWSAIITNQSGTQTVEINSSSNPYILNVSECPHGENVLFSFSSPGYKSRSYYQNLYPGNSYNIKAYLPPNILHQSDTTSAGETNQTCETRSKYDIKTITNTSNDVIVTLTYTPTDIISVEVFECDQTQLQTKNDIQSITNTSNDLTINTSHPIHEIIGVYVYNTSSYGEWVSVPNDKYTYNSTSVTINHTMFDANTTMAKVYYYYISLSDSLAYGTWVPVANDKYTASGNQVTVNHTTFTNHSLMVRVTYYYTYCYGTTIETPLYILQVVGPQGEFTSPPVDEAKIYIKRYMNTTGKFENVSILLTDANGQADVYLIPGVLYKLVITKTGYETEYADYIPTLEVNTRTFRITPRSLINVTYLVSDFIQISVRWFSNTTKGFYATYNDLASHTVNVSFRVYYYNNDTLFYIYNTTSSSFNTSNIPANRSLAYKWVFIINHTYWNYTIHIGGILPPSFMHSPTIQQIEDYLNTILGVTPLVNQETGQTVSWLYVIIGIIAVIILLTFGSYKAEAGLGGMGIWFIFVYFFIHGINIAILTAGIFLLVLAILMRMRERGG